MKYQSFVGLEIHIHLRSRTKAFCSCPAHFGDEPNTNVCPVCMGYPGVLPALNEEALAMAYRTAHALGCTLERESFFERKSYFYPDMPKNYQISQFARPVGRGGAFEFELGGGAKTLRLRECHFEEDAGKMIHAGEKSLLDFNRAGCPLLEIVTEPELSSGTEAEAMLRSLRRLVRHLGVCDGNMEEGSLRCDANVSVNTEGAGLGTKVEVKNMNSFRFVREAIEFEIERQTKALDEGERIWQETRLWNENHGATATMRRKESSHDYRFFPEPDLPAFAASDEYLAGIASAAIASPLARKRALLALGIPNERADSIVEERGLAELFDAALAAGAEAAATATFMESDIRARVNRFGLSQVIERLDGPGLAAIVQGLAAGEIGAGVARAALDAAVVEGKDPRKHLEEASRSRIADYPAIEAIARSAVAAERDSADAFLAGNAKALSRVMGAAMRASKGMADPRALEAAIRKEIGS